MHKIVLIIAVISSLGLKAFGQMAFPKNEGKEQLLKVLNKHTRYPRELAEKNISSLFSFKIVFSTNNQIDAIVPSKYTPEKMIPELTNREYYQGVNWKAIFNREIVKGDILIIPIVAYNKTATQSVYNEYLSEDIFTYQGTRQDFINCLIMQTYTINYGDIIK